MMHISTAMLYTRHVLTLMVTRPDPLNSGFPHSKVGLAVRP